MLSLDKERQEKAEAWIKEHDCTLEDDPKFPGHKKVGAIGGELTTGYDYNRRYYKRTGI